LPKGCEGSAILHHGSYLRFGCLQFVFTVVDCNDVSDDSDILCLTKKLKIQPKDSAVKQEEGNPPDAGDASAD
jgi:hypothetical protein